MPHKFFKTGDLSHGLDRTTRNFYLSRFYRTCALFTLPLPSRLRQCINHTIDDAIDYRNEVLNIIELLFANPFVQNNVTVRALVFAIMEHYDNPHASEFLESIAPRLFGWFKFFAGSKRVLTKEVHDRVEYYKKSKSVFDHTPAEVAKFFEAELIRKNGMAPLREGSIRIHFFSSLEKGKYRSGQVNQPDLMMDLFVHRTEGADLGWVRKTLGLESLAIITDTSPFRTVFETTNEDRLSPIAAWDLSKQFSRPIRVFEPRVTKLTRTTRTIRGPSYPVFFFMFTLLKLIFGVLEKNTAYMGLLYGQSYATVYECIGKVTSTVKQRVVRPFLKLLFVIFLVPLMAAYAALYSVFRLTLFASFATLCASKSVMIWVCTELPIAIGNAVLVTFSLDAKTWLIILALCWFGLADYYDVRA
ncbi:hypothetical protein BDZ97DRAFT_1838820 [Flammula alnicola]|nr:hypothetical protein BDZ97DRAFT_1838820 [Flammula alnicola]